MATVREYMATDLVTRDATDSVRTAAQAMDTEEIGDVLVMKDGELCGIVTDRDLVVRVLAEGRDVDDTVLGDVCTHELTTTSPDADLNDVGIEMREHAIRRMPVVEDGEVVGIVSIGDLAIILDEHSALAEISAASPQE